MIDTKGVLVDPRKLCFTVLEMVEHSVGKRGVGGVGGGGGVGFSPDPRLTVSWIKPSRGVYAFTKY